MTEYNYDLLVIGSGPGGQSAALVEGGGGGGDGRGD